MSASTGHGMGNRVGGLAHCLCAAALAACWAAGICEADEVYLRDGRTVTGTIERESSSSVTVRYLWKDGIYKEDEIPRFKIKEIVRDTPDRHDFMALPPAPAASPNSFSTDEYHRLLTAYSSFLAHHPASPRLQEVRERMEAAEAERERVATGQVKRDGRWYTATQWARRSFETMATPLAEAVTVAIRKNDPEQLLAAWRIYRREAFGSLKTPAVLEAVQAALARFHSTGTVPPATQTLTNDLDEIGNAERTRITSSISLSNKAEALLDRDEADEARVAATQALALWPENRFAKALQAEAKARLDAEAIPIPRRPLDTRERVVSTDRQGKVEAEVLGEQGRAWLRGTARLLLTDHTAIESTYPAPRKAQAGGTPTVKEERPGPDRTREEVSTEGSGRALLKHSGSEASLPFSLDTKGDFNVEISSHIRRAYEEVANARLEILVRVGDATCERTLTREQLHALYTNLK